MLEELENAGKAKKKTILIEEFNQEEHGGQGITYTIYVIDNKTGDWDDNISIPNLETKHLKEALKYFKKGCLK